MLLSKVESISGNLNFDEIPGSILRPGPALHVRVDGHRIVERRATELRRLQRQFKGVVTGTSRFQDDSLEAWRSESYIPTRQRWCPRLERDVGAVCSEAGLSAITTAAIVDASRSGLIPQNPGVLLSRLLRFQDCLSGPLGRRGVLSVLRTAPSLLRYSPESLRWNVDMLASLLPDAAALAVAVRKAPMLLAASAITLWGNFEGLRLLLRLDHDAALRLVERAPRLLLNSRGALAGRLDDLTLLAGGGAVMRRRVVSVVARQPALLGYFPVTLERNLRAAAAALAVPFSRVQPLLLKQPALAMLARESLRARIVALRDAVGLYDAGDLARVVLRQPSLLTLSPENVRQKVAVVTRVLRLQERPSELRTVLRGAPQLLTLAADSIETKAAQLRAAVAPCHELAAQLEGAPPQTVALWLCMSSRRYEHVRAMAEAEAAAAAAAEAVCRVMAGLPPAAEGPAEAVRAGEAARASLGTGGVTTASAPSSPPQELEEAGLVLRRVSSCSTSCSSSSSTSSGGAPTARRRGRPRKVQLASDPLEVAATQPPPAQQRPRLSLYALLRDGPPPPPLTESGPWEQGATNADAGAGSELSVASAFAQPPTVEVAMAAAAVPPVTVAAGAATCSASTAGVGSGGVGSSDGTVASGTAGTKAPRRRRAIRLHLSP